MLIGMGIQGLNRDTSKLLDLNPQSLLIMQEESLEARELKRRGWDGRVLLRFYDDNRMAREGAERAEEDWQWLLDNNQDGIVTDIIPANELNLSSEHGNSPEPWDTTVAYLLIKDWVLSYFQRFRELDASRKYKLHWPALSPGHNPTGTPPEWEYEQVQAALLAADIVDAHTYGPLDDKWTGTKRLGDLIIPKIRSLGVTQPIMVTEVNGIDEATKEVNLDYADFCRYAATLGVKAVYWFIWRGNPDQAAFNFPDSQIQRAKDYMAEQQYPADDPAGEIQPPSTPDEFYEDEPVADSPILPEIDTMWGIVEIARLELLNVSQRIRQIQDYLRIIKVRTTPKAQGQE